MLARHLLFLATRRPHNALLPLTGESTPAQAVSPTPPPYVGPPQPRDWQTVQRRVDYDDDGRNNKNTISKDVYQQDYRVHEDNRTSYGQSQRQQQSRSSLSLTENCRNSRALENINQPYYEPPRYGDNRIYSQQIVKAENARNQQLCGSPAGDGKQFFTLPTRRPARDVEPQRSVTPDITRGLGRGPLSAMHMLARHGQKPAVDGAMGQTEHCADSNRRGSMEQIQMGGPSRLVDNLSQQQTTADARNRFVAPLGLSALGYRFFASSPVRDTDRKSTETVRHPTISPIATANTGNAFKSSTPTTRSNPTVAERLTLVGNNCPSPIPGASGRSTPTQNSSGRNTPTNLSIISPTRSTMSNEELFAAIHKSKRRLNIKDDAESLSPASSTSSLVKAQAGTRHSWSPETQKAPEIPPTVQSPSATSRLDFKRLLLQQSVKTGPTRLSAAEQLKLSRQQSHQQQQQYQQQHYHHQSIPQNMPQVPLAKVLSPRSVWRFQTPRTDVLSSTIIEDAAAEEKAMKPSPENPTTTSRMTSRRQLDLSEKLPDRLARNEAHNERTRNNVNSVNSVTGMQTRISHTATIKAPNAQTISSLRQSGCAPYSENPTNPSNLRQTMPVDSAQNMTASHATAPCNYENRRITNQLARAQFLAGLPVANNNNNNNNQRQSAYFEKRFRARSESPKPAAAQSVARSPSAPTLETAL